MNDSARLFKSLVASLLAAAMPFAAGCGGDGDSSASNQTPSPTNTNTSTNQPTCNGLTVSAQQAGTPPSQAITLSKNVSVNGSATDEYAWTDSAGRTRTVALIRNGCIDARGRHGGYAEQFTYGLSGGTTRVVAGTPNTSYNGAGGFGYVVSHLQDASRASQAGEDDSPLDGGNLGAYRTVFFGFNHAIHEFTLNYPRWGYYNGQYIKYQVPVTIQWLVATGKDHPLWSVTYDLSAVPESAVQADSRAPYGDMQFDGATDGFGDVIGKVAWGEKYQFQTTAAPVTLSVAWTWNTLNPYAPYSYLTTQTTDAEMGLAGTRTITHQDAGGYTGGAGRNLTSAAYHCTTDYQYGLASFLMPCVTSWPYQTVGYSFYDNSGNGSSTVQTDSKRVAWGTDWYLGVASQSDVNGNTASGWPYLSYSTYIAMGPKSTTPTILAAEQAQTGEATTLAAVAGCTVKTQGIAGVGRTDTITYSPAGYDPVYATWRLQATSSSSLQFSLAVANTPAADLINPIVVIDGVTDASAPTLVKVGATTLTSGTEYYSSYDPVHQQLWLTLVHTFTRNTSSTMTVSL
jgi:hypothetical protein